VPVLTDEPALSFWLDYAERRGALVEEHPDHALVLLPDPLQRESELPEEASVTASPDVAREDGAALLIAGHPAVERAAASVLAEGDTGCAYLPWPSSRPPTRSALEALAREHAAVEHGRVDAAGEPIAAYLPLLRAGAMVSYAASLTLRFQEQEEAWVDARTGSIPSDRVLAALQNRLRLPAADGPRRTLQPNLPTAIRAVHEQLERRAAARQASLAPHAKRAFEMELARADAYYEAALESIGRRGAAAPPDRARLLDAQAEATRAEWGRRRREIEEEYRPRREVRPFRLHLVYLPAYVLEVDIRRGSSTFRSEFSWVPAAGEFTAVSCPTCGATEPLVATRERLGCRACVAPASAAMRELAPRTDTPRHTPAAQPAPPPPQLQAARKPPAAAHRRAPAPAGSGLRRQMSRNGGRTGDKLAFDFWRSLALGNRWPRQKAARDSPLRAVYRMFGDEGPLRAIGLATGEYPESVSAATRALGSEAGMLTTGTVLSRGRRYVYALFWWMAAGRPIIGEVMPMAHPLALPPLGGVTADIASRLLGEAPSPMVELDPVASALWQTEVERFGLPFAIRCLATWWRIRPVIDPSVGDAALAATVATAVARAAGVTRNLRAETAVIYGADSTLVTTTGRKLQALLQLDPRRGW
jgi:hypothetical protein